MEFVEESSRRRPLARQEPEPDWPEARAASDLTAQEAPTVSGRAALSDRRRSAPRERPPAAKLAARPDASEPLAGPRWQPARAPLAASWARQPAALHVPRSRRAPQVMPSQEGTQVRAPGPAEPSELMAAPKHGSRAVPTAVRQTTEAAP